MLVIGSGLGGWRKDSKFNGLGWRFSSGCWFCGIVNLKPGVTFADFEDQKGDREKFMLPLQNWYMY